MLEFVEDTEEPVEVLCDEVETVKEFCQSPPQTDRHLKPINAVAKRLGRQMGKRTETVLELDKTARI